MNSEYSDREISMLERYEYTANAKYDKACDELDAIFNL